MSDQRDPGAKLPGTPPGRRPPTIDLTATEIASTPGAGPAGGAEQATTRANEPAQNSAANAASSDPRREDGGSGAGAPPRGPRFSPLFFGWRPPDPRWPLVGAAAGGASLIILVAVLLWAGGLLAPGTGNGDMVARLARLESQIGELTKHAAPAADTKALSDVAARLGKIEAALAATPSDPGPTGRLAAAESAIKSASSEIAALRARLDDVAADARKAQSRADAAAGTADAAQKSTQSTTAELARAAQADDRGGRLAVAAGALRAAVERYEPFAAELAAAKSFAPDAKILMPLDPFAATGIPSAGTLARDLNALVPALLVASSAAAPNGGFLDKLQINAERLVRIRPVGEVAGDDAASIVARIEVKAAQVDIDGALAELTKLPPAIRSPAESWMKTAQQRQAALTASRQFARDALAALSKPAL